MKKSLVQLALNPAFSKPETKVLNTRYSSLFDTISGLNLERRRMETGVQCHIFLLLLLQFGVISISVGDIDI